MVRFSVRFVGKLERIAVYNATSIKEVINTGIYTHCYYVTIFLLCTMLWNIEFNLKIIGKKTKRYYVL
jgi:hypothetical protein